MRHLANGFTVYELLVYKYILTALFVLAILCVVVAKSNAQDNPFVEFVRPTQGEQLPVGTDQTVTVEASDHDGIDVVRLFVNGKRVGDQRVPAYNWGSALVELPAGEHDLEAVAFDNTGQTSNVKITITIGAAEVEPPPVQDICPECTGIRTDRDMAIDADMVRMCIPNETTAVHWEIEYDDGELIAIDSCWTELVLWSDRRVRARSRFIQGTEFTEWSGWIRDLVPLEANYTCPGDFDLNGDVNGADFVIFRRHFIKGFCE